MTFDANISDEVSLSKILDEFIKENEKPETIVIFLKQHDDSFDDIMKFSLHCNRLFQLDFFLKCKNDGQEYIISKLKSIDPIDAALFTWQVLKSNSGKVQHAKYKFRNELQWIFNSSIRHPYACRHETYISSLDNACFKLAETDRIQMFPFFVNRKEMCKQFKYLNYSLFQNRLLQYDVFSSFNDVEKYMFISEAFSCCNKSNIKRFAMQLLDSDEHATVKETCLSYAYSLLPKDILDEKTLKVIDSCKSFAEMQLKIVLFNADVSQNVIFHLLIYKPAWVIEWIEYDKDELDMNLNVSCLLPYLKKRKQKHSR